MSTIASTVVYCSIRTLFLTIYAWWFIDEFKQQNQESSSVVAHAIGGGQSTQTEISKSTTFACTLCQMMMLTLDLVSFKMGRCVLNSLARRTSSRVESTNVGAHQDPPRASCHQRQPRGAVLRRLRDCSLRLHK